MGRSGYTDDQHRELCKKVDEWRASGLNVDQACAEVGYKPHLYSYHSKKLSPEPKIKQPALELEIPPKVAPKTDPVPEPAAPRDEALTCVVVKGSAADVAKALKGLL